MQKTLQALTTDVEKMLYQAAGPAVQIYAQDVIMQKIQQAFDHVFTTKFWPQFMVREVRTLDGATGLVTAPFTSIIESKDIHSIFRKNSDRPIPQLPYSINTLDIPVGTAIKFYAPRTDANLFTAYPLDAVDQLVVIGRSRPANEFIATDIVPFDHLALEYWAAWEYSIDDASNAGMAAKFQGLFDSRMKELEDAEFSHVVMLNPRSEEIPTRWY